MKLRIVYGRADKDKSGYCMQEIVKALEQKGAEESMLLFLVPEQFTVQAETMLLARTEGTKSILRADVINFKRMAHRVVTELSEGYTKVLDNAGRRMLLYRAVESCQSQLKLFRGATERFGLLGELLTLLDEAGRYRFSPEKMEAVANALPTELPMKQKLTELALIGQTYEAMLHESYLETKDMLDLLAEKITQYKPYQGMQVWIDGFSGFTPQEYAIITAMLQTASQVTVTLSCDQPGADPRMEADFLRSIQQTYQHLVRIATALQIPVERIACPIDRPMHATLQHLEKEYDSYPAHVFPGTEEDMEHLGIYAGKNIYSEVEFAAGTIQRLCREKGLRFRDIAVVAKQIETYGPVCKDVFAKYEIPIFMDEKRDLTRHPLAKLILSALGVVTEHFSYKAMFTYLKNGLLCYDQELLDEMENRALAQNIGSYARWTDLQRWLYEDKELEARIAVEKEAILKPLRQLREGLQQQKTVRGQAEALYAFLLEIEVPQIIENRQNEEYIQIWNGFLNVLDKLVEALGEEPITAQRFLQLLKAGLSDCQIGEIPAAIDRVQIGNLDRTKNPSVKALLFLGVNEGVVPASGSKEGLLTDRERNLLKEYDVTLAPDSREQAYLEEFQIYEAMVRPEQYLFVSYVIKDSSGKSRRPSLYVNRLRAMFPQIPVLDDMLTEEMYARPMESVVAKEQAFAKLMHYLGDEEPSAVWEEVHRFFVGQPAYEKRLQDALQYRQGKQTTGNISQSLAEALFGRQVTTSISRVERYNACPYAFYLDYGLKVKEREILTFNRRDTGTFVHSILERLQTDFSPENVDKVVKEVLAENQVISMQDTKRAEFLTRQIGDMVKRVCTVLSSQAGNSLFAPTAFETECRLPISLPEGKTAQLTGIIDRIDTYKDGDTTYYRVIDYKTGSKRFHWGEVYAGTTVQLMTYLDSLTKEKQTVPAGAFYFPVRERFQRIKQTDLRATTLESMYREKYKLSGVVLAEPDVVKAMDTQMGDSSAVLPVRLKKDGSFSAASNVATREQFDMLFAHVEKVIGDAITGYTGGKVAPCPTKKKNGSTACDYCKFSAACGFDPGAGDTYRTVEEVQKKEIWEMLEHDY